MNVAEALREAAARLSPTSDTARLDAELLMAHALKASRSDMLLRHMSEAAPKEFAALVVRRARHEPVAYITGTQEFYGLKFEVSPSVLIPRSDSETVIEAAREVFDGRDAPRRILDLGTGSGALLLATLTIWPEAEGLGVDSSAEALLIAIRNAQAHANTLTGIVGSPPVDLPPLKPDRGFARFIQRDWTKPGWSADLGRFDLILANPPYVEANAPLEPSVRDYEPAGALFAGPEGLDDYRILIPQMPGLLAEHGVAVFEIGATQAEAVAAIAQPKGLAVSRHKDLAGRTRALAMTLGLGK